MFAAGAASEITSAHEYPPFETGIVHRKSGSETAILVITPVTEQVFTEALARSGFKKTRRYYLIGIYVFHLYRYCGRSKYCKFLCHIFFIKRVRPPYFLYPFLFAVLPVTYLLRSIFQNTPENRHSSHTFIASLDPSQRR